MDFLVGIMKNFVSRFFTMFPFCTPRYYQSNLWFPDVTLKNGNKTETLGGHWSSFLTHFNPVFLCYTPCKRQKLLRLIFKKFNNCLIQGTTFSKCFWILSIGKESPLIRVSGVPKQASFSVQINILQTQGVEITLIQCCFNVTTLNQR